MTCRGARTWTNNEVLHPNYSIAACFPLTTRPLTASVAGENTRLSSSLWAKQIVISHYRN